MDNELTERMVAGPAAGSGRCDRDLMDLFPDQNRSQIQKALETGLIRVNGLAFGKKDRLRPGDLVEWQHRSPASHAPVAVAIALDVIHEDEHLIVVNKAAGMVTHPGNGTGDDTLVHALLAHCEGKLSRINGEDRPGIVHRLDKETSGLLVAAKDDRTCEGLLQLFREHDLIKEYRAVVAGVPAKATGSCQGTIARHPVHRTRMAVLEGGRPARTDWRLLQSGGGAAELLCRIHSGRTHQIRVHLSNEGHPIVGDALYGYRTARHRKDAPQALRPLLHSFHLVFRHPVSGQLLDFQCDPPEDYLQWIHWMNPRIQA
jgi:23S rRNA pseudouridine1911/1915/1917 synthase